MDYVAKTIAAYDASPEKYEQATSDMINEPEFDKFEALLPQSSAPVLDAGCAFGVDTAILNSRHIPAIGIDLSTKFIERAKQLHPSLRFELMDIRHLNFSTESFRGVWCRAVLLHLNDADILKALREYYRVLEPGGVLALSMKEGEGSEERVEAFSSDAARFFNYKTLATIRPMLEEAGFKYEHGHIINERERFGPAKRDLNWIWASATKR